MMAVSDPTLLRRRYGRAHGRPLREGLQGVLAAQVPRYQMPMPLNLADPSALFPRRPEEIWLEIGFGKGGHLAFQAARNPHVGLIGCEPFLNGFVAGVAGVAAAGLENVRVYRGDALDVLEALPSASVARVFLLHPDPWPKMRHARRRFINPGPLDWIARVLKPGGQLRVATDHPVYGRWTLMQMAARRDFLWTAQTPADWQTIPDDWPDTRYGAKARAVGHEVWRFTYCRL